VASEKNIYQIVEQSLKLLFEHEKMKSNNTEFKITRTQFINMKNRNGLTALHFASFRGNVKLIKYLTRNGADPRITDNEGRTVLHVAVQNEQVDSIYYFIKNLNFDMNQADNNSSSPLHWAAIGQKEISLTYLIAWGAEVNIKDNDGNTPLHLAVKSTEDNNTR